MSDFEFGMDWKWLDPRPSAGPNAELDRSQLLSGAHTINDHISTSPQGRVSCKFVYWTQILFLSIKTTHQRVMNIACVFTTNQGNFFCQFRTIDDIRLIKAFWFQTSGKTVDIIDHKRTLRTQMLDCPGSVQCTLGSAWSGPQAYIFQTQFLTFCQYWIK